MRRAAIVGITSLVLTTPAAALQVVDSCRTNIVGGKAVLAGDLDCTGESWGVRLQSAQLDLAGFTLTGGNSHAVSCIASCKVKGPGVITGSPACGVAVSQVSDLDTGIARARVSNVTVTGNECGVRALGVNRFDLSPEKPAGQLKIEDSIISGNATFGVWANKKVSIKGSVISGNGEGGVGCDVFNDGCSVSVVGGGRTKIVDTSVTSNGTVGVASASKVSLVRATVQGNGLHGIEGTDGIKVSKSDVTGNGVAPECGVTMPCADLATRFSAPKVRNTSVCETSYDETSGFPGTSWGVCSLD